MKWRIVCVLFKVNGAKPSLYVLNVSIIIILQKSRYFLLVIERYLNTPMYALFKLCMQKL